MLADTDPRWLAFGFEMPGSPAMPDVPENVVVTAGAAGSHLLFLHWDDSRRADGYRAKAIKVEGGATVAEELTQDAEVCLSKLPAGAAVDIVVTARNAAGESQPSVAVRVVVP